MTGGCLADDGGQTLFLAGESWLLSQTDYAIRDKLKQALDPPQSRPAGVFVVLPTPSQTARLLHLLSKTCPACRVSAPVFCVQRKQSGTQPTNCARQSRTSTSQLLPHANSRLRLLLRLNYVHALRQSKNNPPTALHTYISSPSPRPLVVFWLVWPRAHSLTISHFSISASTVRP